LKTTCALDVWRLRALYPNCSMQDGFFFFFSGFSSKDNDGQANFAKSWCSKIRIINSQSDNWLVDHFVFLFFQEFYSLRMANRIQHSGVQWGILYVLLKFYLLIKVFARDFFFLVNQIHFTSLKLLKLAISIFVLEFWAWKSTH